MNEDGFQFTFQVVQHLQRENGPVREGVVSVLRPGGQVLPLLLECRRSVRRGLA